MEKARFANVIRLLGTVSSRRMTLWALLASTFAALPASSIPDDAAAKKHHHHRHTKKKRTIVRNAFGCVDVGGFCNNSGDCCSGVCQEKKDKKTCQAHDASTCLAGQDVCSENQGDCVTTTGDRGNCARTTGNASYSEAGGDCFPCTRDADCVPFCGPQAACIICQTTCDEQGNTVCVGLSEDSCNFP
jgi:hypothetical protein